MSTEKVEPMERAGGGEQEGGCQACVCGEGAGGRCHRSRPRQAGMHCILQFIARHDFIMNIHGFTAIRNL